MNEAVHINPRTSERSSSSRPTIALLGAELEFHIPVSYLKSTMAVAEAADVNLLYFSSAPLRTPYRFDIQANIMLISVLTCTLAL